MNPPTIEDLRTLMDYTDGPCISMRIPTTEVGPEGRESARIRLKNAIDLAEVQLEARIDKPHLRKLLQPAEALLERGGLWAEDAASVVIYLADDFSLVRKINPPADSNDMNNIAVVSAQRFVLRPVLTRLAREQRFLILAISANKVRLLDATQHDATDITPEEMPQGIQEVLRFDDPEAHLQLHTSRPTINAPGGHAAMHHGQSVPEDDARHRRYILTIMDYIEPVLVQYNLPVVLAGVKRWFPHVREVTDYDVIWKESLDGNPDELSVAELRKRTWQVFQPVVAEKLKDVWDRYQTAAAAQSVGTADKLKAIVRAAMHGHVDTLYLPDGNPQWGKYDIDTDTLTRVDDPAESEGDLVDLAAAHTLTTGGRITFMPEDVDLDTPVAILRFPLAEEVTQ